MCREVFISQDAKCGLILFVALLYILLSSGACVLCHVALDFLFEATKHLIFEGK